MMIFDCRNRLSLQLLSLSLAGCLTVISFCLFQPRSEAATTVPLRIVYNGHLLSSNGSPVTTAHTVRFSFWSSADSQSSDITGAGDVNTSAATYQGWTEVHTVTPDSNGYFTVNLGSVTALPDIRSFSPAVLQSLFLQVEVKASASANTAYEVMDVNSADTAVDRSPVASVPFSLNADYLDQREIGTGSGNIPILGPGNVFNTATIPGGTNSGKFIIDFDNTESGDITLQFGGTLSKTLSYSQANSYFRFNDSVYINGNLTVTGLINGINLASLSSSTDTHLKVSSGAGLSVSIAAGGYRVAGATTQFAGSGSVTVRNNATNYLFFTGTGLVVSSAGFPGSGSGSHLRLAEVVTSGGNVTIVRDRRVLQSDDREKDTDIVIQPGYEGVAYRPDGTNNVGRLVLNYDSTNRRNYYQWASTPASLQDYDLVVPIRIPEGFLQWESPALILNYRTDSADNTLNKIDVSVFDTAGNAVTLTGTSTGLASSSWASTSLSFSGTPTWTVGQDAIVVIRAFSKSNSATHVGALELSSRIVTP